MGEADDGRELGPNRVIVALFLFFSGVGWLCAVGGLAAMQNYCVDGQTFIYVNVYVPLFAYSCSNIYALDWWVVWFTFLHSHPRIHFRLHALAAWISVVA
eukprot:EC119092.1.p1 GENE.EC119092.1~~EC119092.1.p1  ORF type:complete len:100 (+),score=1.63 EC119092.1:94-393(+)